MFGVRSQVRMKIPGDPIIRVVPPLPQLRIKVLPVLLNRDDGTGNFPIVRREGNRSSVGARDKFELLDGEM